MSDPVEAVPPSRKPPQSERGEYPLSADDRLVLMLAGLIAARMVSDFEPREFQGMRSPRFETAMERSLSIARSLISRHRSWLLQRAQ